MTSEPMAAPVPLTLPDTSGGIRNVGGSAKRKAAEDGLGDGLSGNSNQHKKRKDASGKSKKARTVNELPGGLRIRMVDTSLPSSSTAPIPQIPARPARRSTSISPPPPRRLYPPTNPDDRPLPLPKARNWEDAVGTDDIPQVPPKRSKPPSTSSTKPPSSSNNRLPQHLKETSNLSSRSGSGSSLVDKGKGRATSFADLDSSGDTPEELEQLKELDGALDELQSLRENESSRRKVIAPSIGEINVTLPPPNKSKPKLKKLKQLAQPPSFQATAEIHHPPSMSGSQISSNGLHSSTSMVPIPMQDTPKIKKNKEMRDGQGKRKSSLGLRSARVSESFGAGILAHPHSSVDAVDFYTHISPELPDPIRARQLLVWCSHRAVSSSPSSSSAQRSAPPPLSSKQKEVLEGIQDEVMRIMCLGKVDTSLGMGDSSSSSRLKKKVKEHPRNIENRKVEQRFLAKEAQAHAEEEAWSEVIQALNSRQTSVINALSTRAQKRKELPTDALDWPLDDIGQDHLLARSAELVAEERKAGIGVLDEGEQKLVNRTQGIESLVDDLGQGMHTASTLIRKSDSHLAAFARALSSRLRSRLGNPAGEALSPASARHWFSDTSQRVADPLVSLRALSRTAKGDGQSDAARRAAMALERGVGERRLTAIPATPSTRRTIAGTPRKSAGKRQ